MPTTTFNNRQPFVALIAHKPCIALSILKLPNLFTNSYILTQTFNETAIAITNQAFGLVIVDLNLNGVEIVTIAKKLDSINFQTPIIALTDNIDINAQKSLIATGFDDCLRKPLTSKSLIETMDFWCGGDSPFSCLHSIDTLLAKCKYNYALVLKICHQLFEDLPLQINEVESALKQGSYKNAFEATHKINGSAKVCYLHKIGESADILEKALIEKNTPDADRYFLALQQRIMAFLKHRETIMEYLYESLPNAQY